jgi:hypothetical protein
MSTMKKTLKRGGLVAALLALTMAFAAPVASATPGSEATEWLASQLKTPKAGEKYCDLFGPNVGQTVDCMLAFDAAAGFEAEENETYKWILANMSSYVGGKPCSEASSMSAGAVAKLALGVGAHGGNPMSVGGRNLIADLQCLQASSGPEKGRFKDKGAADFSNVFGQSLALIALKACQQKKICASPPGSLGTTLTNGATYLRGQQCAENGGKGVKGAFRSAMGLEPGTCENTTPFPSETEFNVNAVDIDSTGFAIEGLYVQAGATNVEVAKAGAEWMYKERKEAGPPKRIYWESYCSFSEATKKFPSVNSTALAIMGASEIELEIIPAQEWLADAVASGENRGLPACGATGNGDVLATSQGILGLYGTSYPTLVGL